VEFQSPKVHAEAMCIIELFVTSPLMILILFVSTYQSIRYFTLTNINKHKQHLALYHVYKEQLKKEKKETEPKTNPTTPGSPINEQAPSLRLSSLSPTEVRKIVKYKFQHFILSRLLIPWVVVTGAIVFYFWYAGGLAIIWISAWRITGDPSCPMFTAFPVAMFWYSLNVLMLIVIAIVVIILDGIANWKLVSKCAFKKLFTTHDPFLFRAEYSKSLVILLWALVSFTGLATADYISASLNPFIPVEVQILLAEINSIVVQVALLWNNILFALVITFYWEKKGKTGFEQNYVSEVTQVLDNPDLSQKFQKFGNV
jgi:hypothetical protein